LLEMHVSVHGLPIKPGLALGSWAAFLGTDDKAMVMGDLVLLESEVNPVVAKLRSCGFEISAVHNHLMEETPRVLYVHYMGHGPAAQLAISLRVALSVSRTPLEKPAAAAEEIAPPAWVRAVEDAVGRKDTFKGGVLSYGVPRSDAVTMGGMTIAPAAGVAEVINFQGRDDRRFRAHCRRGHPCYFRTTRTPHFRYRIAQPHAHRRASPVFHALLVRRQPGIGGCGDQSGAEPCGVEVSMLRGEA
jgi:hypothetical protein